MDLLDAALLNFKHLIDIICNVCVVILRSCTPKCTAPQFQTPMHSEVHSTTVPDTKRPCLRVQRIHFNFSAFPIMYNE